MKTNGFSEKNAMPSSVISVNMYITPNMTTVCEGPYCDLLEGSLELSVLRHFLHYDHNLTR